jgi:four helix bundle protein
MRNDKDNVIVDKTINFSLAIINYCEALEQEKKYVIARQLLRSATSIGANVFEAQNAESKADFIHKMKVAAKEASETLYWLILCERAERYRFEKKFRNELDEIIKILSKIISSSKRKMPGFIWGLIYAFSNFQILKLIH